MICRAYPDQCSPVVQQECDNILQQLVCQINAVNAVDANNRAARRVIELENDLDGFALAAALGNHERQFVMADFKVVSDI